MFSIPIICFTLEAIMLCATPQPEYDTTALQVAIEEYQGKYLDLDVPEEGSTREYLTREQKDGD